MRSRNSSALLLIFLGWGVAGQQPGAAPKPDEKPASIEGVVIHALTGEPIPRAHVACDTVVGAKQQQFGAITNAEGKFAITGLPAGGYWLTAERVGFVMPVENGRSGVSAAVKPGDAKSDLKLKLTPTGAILGRVVDADGKPVEGAVVIADPGAQRGGGASSVADEKGQFRIGGLAPGRYRVRASTPSPAFPPEIRNDGIDDTRYVPTYHPSAVEPNGATRLVVRSGADLAGIDIQMQRSPIVRLSGVVTGIPPGVPAERVYLELRRGNSAFGRSGVRPDGKFELWSIDPGKWLVTAVVNSQGQVMRSAALEIEVARQNLDNLELRMVPPFDLAGQIVFEDENSKPKPGSGLQRIALQAIGRTMTPQPVTPDAGGAFKFTNVQPGRCHLVTWWSASVKSIRLGSVEAEGNVLDLTNGSAGETVTVVLGPASAEVSGTVTDDNGPVAGATVVLASPYFTSWASIGARTARTAADGSFRITEVPTARYLLYAADEDDASAISGNSEDYEDVLVNVEVRAGDRLVKDLKRHGRTR